MLVLAYPNGLRVDFYQLRQRILHPAGNRHGSTNGNIIFRQFLLGQGRGGVNRSSRLVGNDIVHIQAIVLDEIGGKFFCFQRSGAVAYGNKIHMMLLYESKGGFGSFLGLFFASGNVEDSMIQYPAGRIYNGHFATGAVAGI